MASFNEIREAEYVTGFLSREVKRERVSRTEVLKKFGYLFCNRVFVNGVPNRVVLGVLVPQKN